jgi:predicted Zn-dependent protease
LTDDPEQKEQSNMVGKIARRWIAICGCGATVLLLSAGFDGPAGPLPATIAQAAERPRQGGDQPGGGALWDPQKFDPQKFMEQLLGEETEADKQRLAEVQIARQEEKQLGDRALKMFLASLQRQRVQVRSRGREVRYLQRLVEELKPHMRRSDRYREFRVLLAETPRSDARCFPGGTLVIFRGMLDAVQSEAALVCVLGHELSHIDHGHQLRHLKSWKLAQQTMEPQRQVDLQQVMDNAMFVARTFARPFRPEHEREADLDAVTWAYRLGYDPLEFAKLFLRWERRDRRLGRDAVKRQMPQFLRTHPYHRDRYQAVVRRVDQLKRSEPRGDPHEDLYVGRTNLLRRIPRSQREYDE